MPTKQDDSTSTPTNSKNKRSTASKPKRKYKKREGTIKALITAEELENANAAAREIVPDYGPDGGAVAPVDHAIEGLEWLSGEMTDDQKIVLNTLLTDVFGSPEEETRSSIYNKLYAACNRAGMAKTKGLERRFFHILADPMFGKIYKVAARGLVSSEVLSVLNKVIEQAKEGCKVSQKRILELADLIPDKYDYYSRQYSERHQTINVEQMNIGEKTTKELVEIADAIWDVAEEVQDGCSSGTGETEST